jgi:hypothetical protein
MGEDLATPEVAESFFPKGEFEALKASPIYRRTATFFNCWLQLPVAPGWWNAKALSGLKLDRRFEPFRLRSIL